MKAPQESGCPMCGDFGQIADEIERLQKRIQELESALEQEMSRPCACDNDYRKDGGVMDENNQIDRRSTND